MNDYSYLSSPECGNCVYYNGAKRIESEKGRVAIFETQIKCSKINQNRTYRTYPCQYYEKII